MIESKRTRFPASTAWGRCVPRCRISRASSWLSGLRAIPRLDTARRRADPGEERQHRRWGAPRMSDDAPLVTRVFSDLDTGASVSVEIDAPRRIAPVTATTPPPDPDAAGPLATHGHWICDFRIRRADGTREFQGANCDSMGALCVAVLRLHRIICRERLVGPSLFPPSHPLFGQRGLAIVPRSR